MSGASAIQSTIDRGAHTVLVVDDNAVTRYSTARVIRAAGFQTVEAGTGGEALALAGQSVSAVVLDVHLPDMDGFQVCRELRAAPDTALLPVVHLSAAYVKNEDHVTGLNAGADAYMVHPVEPAVLVATLQALIRARTAEEKLRRSERRFRAIYDHAQGGIALLDGAGLFVEANPSLLELLGLPPEAVAGRRLSEFVPAADHTVLQQALATPAQSAWNGEFALQDAAGRLRHVQWSLSPQVGDGLRIATAMDVSGRHELEQQRRELLEREQAARSLAERHSRTKDDFIAVLSHELRTPLNAITGWVHVLQRRGAAPEAARGLEAIERNVKTQARIISDILDVSRINSGKLQLEREAADPAELVRSAIESLGASIASKRLEVRLDLDGAAGAPVLLDPGRFQQVLWNLMTNAIKFSADGGVVEVGLHRDAGRLHLTVRDHGIGIKPEFLPLLFDRFSQSDSPGNRRHGGLGLGLSIVKQLVDLHGGNVGASSEGPGLGTLVWVDLPVQGQAPAAVQGERTEDDDAGAQAHALGGLDIVVVEDDPEAGEMMSVVLGDRGAEVRVARDYDQAMDHLRRRWPDVVVSDIGLPGRDGYELARAVRALQGDRARLPMVALTAFARPEDERRSLDAGFDRHLAKPLRPHVLLSAIRGLLAR